LTSILGRILTFIQIIYSDFFLPVGKGERRGKEANQQRKERTSNGARKYGKVQTRHGCFPTWSEERPSPSIQIPQ
jgi:hypothetical protein